MAEPSTDHPAFTWLMRLLDSRAEPAIGNLEVAGRWVVSDGEGLVARGRNLAELLDSLSDRPMEDLAVAFVRAEQDWPGGGKWNVENQPFIPGGTEVSVSDASVPEASWEKLWEASHAAEAD